MGLIGSILISMRADTETLKRDLGVGASAVNHFGTELSGLGKGLAALGLGVAAVGGLRKLVDSALETESAMAGLSKATDLEGTALAGLKLQLQQLSTTLKGVSVEGLYEIATIGAKMGVPREQLLGYTEAIAKASTAMDDLPVDQIAEGFGKIAGVMKLSTRDVSGIISAVDNLGDSGTSKSKDILELTQRISGTAMASRLAAHEAAALATALLDTGTQAELGATSIQRLLMALNSAEGQEGFAKALGISAEEFAAKVEASPIRAIQDWLAALRDMNAQAQQTAIKEIGVDSVQSAGEIMKLAQQTDVLAKYLKAAASEFQTLNQINKSYNITAATSKAALEQAKNGFKAIADDVGSSLLPAIRMAADLFVQCVPTIRSAVGGICSAVDLGWKTLRASVTAFFGGLAWIGSAALKLFSWLPGLKELFSPVIEFLDNFVAAAKSTFEAAKELIQGTGKLATAAPPLPGTPAAPGGLGAQGMPQAGDKVAAANDAQEMADAVAKLTNGLHEQVEAYGLSSHAAEVYKLHLRGASEESLEQAITLANQLDALDAQRKAQEEAAQAAEHAAKEIASITEKLQEQVTTFGMSSAQLDVYRLKQLGATDAVLAHARALADQRDAMDGAKRAQEDMAKRAKDVIEQTRSPLEKLGEETRKLSELFTNGLIDEDTFGRAAEKLREEFRKEQDQDDGTDPRRKGEKFGKSGLAGALDRDSKEARTAVLSFRGESAGSDGIKGLKKVGDQQLAEAQVQTELLRRVANGGGGPALRKFIA